MEERNYQFQIPISFLYDFDVDGGAVGDSVLTGLEGQTIPLPAGFHVNLAQIKVTTPFVAVPGTGMAFIALSPTQPVVQLTLDIAIPPPTTLRTFVPNAPIGNFHDYELGIRILVTPITAGAGIVSLANFIIDEF